MHPTDDDNHHLTEADRECDTRFGPRPVPEGHIPSNRARRISRGNALSPRDTTLSTKLIVWAGVTLGVAGLTAGSLMAARKISDMTAGDRPKPPLREYYGDRMSSMAPRFADLDEEERENMRRRVRAQARDDAREAARLRAEAGRQRSRQQHGSGNFARDLTRTADDLSGSIEGVANALVKAFTSFRGVASQAAGIMSDFVQSADHIRSVLGGDKPAASSPRAKNPPDDDSDRLHRL